MARASILLRIAGTVTLAAFAATPALAGAVATPAPLLGAGIPALVAFGVGYWALRRRRS
jgi:hypothetical protein